MAPLDVREVFGNEDLDPLPLGIRVGDVLHASRITGVDLTTGKLAADADGQMATAFANLQHVVQSAGGSLDNVGQVSIFVKQRDDMKAINPAWVKMFPLDDDRPTYKFMVADLPGDRLVQLEAFAVIGARRQVLHIPNVAHTNPIPMGVKIGNMVFSSRILPYDSRTGQPAEGFEAQVEAVFANLNTFLKTAGAEPKHLTQARVFIADKAQMGTVEQQWARLYPAGTPRPTIHAVTYGAGTRLQAYIEVIASL